MLKNVFCASEAPLATPPIGHESHDEE